MGMPADASPLRLLPMSSCWSRAGGFTHIPCPFHSSPCSSYPSRDPWPSTVLASLIMSLSAQKRCVFPCFEEQSFFLSPKALHDLSFFLSRLLCAISPATPFADPKVLPQLQMQRDGQRGWPVSKYTWKSLYFLPGSEPSLPHMYLTMEDLNSLQISPYEPSLVARWALPTLFLLSPHLSPCLAPPDLSPCLIHTVTPLPSETFKAQLKTILPMKLYWFCPYWRTFLSLSLRLGFSLTLNCKSSQDVWSVLVSPR